MAAKVEGRMDTAFLAALMSSSFHVLGLDERLADELQVIAKLSDGLPWIIF